MYQRYPPLDISALPSKKRYVINKGKKNFIIREFNPLEYAEEIAEINFNSYKNYPKAYRPLLDKAAIRKTIRNRKNQRTFGAFSIDNNILCAYAFLIENNSWANLAVLKANPSAEKSSVNAALIAGICEFYSSRLSKGYYICDGERNIIHQTAFQDYLIKYFNFRKAYCKLHLAYTKPFGYIVKALYPLRKILHKFCNTRLGSKIDAVLLMEEICRSDK